MVSPSKVQHQEERIPSRENKSDRRSHVRIQKGPKPLEKKSFYLDIKNHAVSAKLEGRIKELGGTIELFLVRSVHIVVSDRAEKVIQINLEKRNKWGCTSVDSGGTPSLRSIEAPTPTPTPPTPFLSSECPFSNSTNLRGQTAQRSKSRVDAMLERALTQPQQCSVDPLENAHSWGIPIWTTDKLQAWLDKIYLSLKDTGSLRQLKGNKQHNSGKDLKVKHLKGPYIKFESYQRNSRPVFLELPAWPTLNFDGEPGSCPFDIKKRDKAKSSAVVKDIKENRDSQISVNIEKGKEMTRRPRTTATRARRTEQLVAGYCEICRVDYRDLSKHVQSDQHLNFVRNDDNFLSLDTLINAGASVEAFLKLNRTKDIGKDCNLFANEDRSLHDVVIPEDNTSKTPTNLNNFDVEDIKMVQYNGARRNLNLKLSPSHNLRTRARHESGHLLRSKGSPWHEVDKSDKFYDKFEGFTIKKRAKGTIWLEEEDGEEKCAEGDESKESRQDDYSVDISLRKFREVLNNDEKNDNIVQDRNLKRTTVSCDERIRVPSVDRDQNEEEASSKMRDESRCEAKVDSADYKRSINGFQVIDSNRISIKTCKNSQDVSVEKQNPDLQDTLDTNRLLSECNGQHELTCNGHDDKSDQKVTQAEKESRIDRQRSFRSNRRGGRTSRGRHRLSVEERLIEDNRAYYKVEVLGSKLRSSVVPGCNVQNMTVKDSDEEEKKEVPSSEKPVVVRFKRVRKSELSLLSDEAESFMFGEPKRDDSSEASDAEQSSILPRDTETEGNETNSVVLSSSSNTSSPVKNEIIEEDSQDSTSLGRARKRRRTQAEAFIKDNADYYKFEVPGSRLRYQAPLNGSKGSAGPEVKEEGSEERLQENVEEKIYPSKPSPEIEKMQFSFEAIPKSEPWYQTYQRQDEGAEFWHYFSEGDTRPFLLPYEIDNFHETLMTNISRNDARRKGRGRALGILGRSPRKSPRCHASTLAIMSTIIRKREQQPSTLAVIEECHSVRSQSNTPGPEQKERKSDVDEELKEMAKNIDEMLNMKVADLEESFEPDNLPADGLETTRTQKGPPVNLLELLDNCHEIGNCLENSSCASSECGEGSSESPLKRRKKRKNRTGWPGIKLKKKLQNKQVTDPDCDHEKNVKQELNTFHITEEVVSHRVLEEIDVSVVITCRNTPVATEDCPNPADRKDESENSSEKPNKTRLDDDATKIKMDDSTERTSVRSVENLDDSAVSEVTCERESSFLSNEDVNAKNLSENDASNDENHENFFRKDANVTTPLRANSRKRQMTNTSSDLHEPHAEIENHETSHKTSESGKKHRDSSCTPTRKRRRDPSDEQESEADRRGEVFGKNSPTKRRIKSRKRQRRSTINRSAVFEDENCIGRKQQGIKRRIDTSSGQETELECALNERVSPTIISSAELEHRRSSVEFQPVVRVMKIDDQVDMENSILSVTVASNRRLRSAGSPKSNVQPPKKRLKTTSRGQFSRWLKNS